MQETNQNQEKRKLSKRQIELRRKKRQRQRILRVVTFGVLVMVIVMGVYIVSAGIKRTSAKKAEEKAQKEAEIAAEEQANQERKDTISQADMMAVQYDYDGAIALLQGIEGYDTDADIIASIAKYTAAKSTCVAVDVMKVPHIFYHSLINDTTRAFDVSTLGQGTVDGFNAWMTTVEEFDAITQQMYDNGYVFVRMRDLVTETTDADGTVHMTANTNLLLPEGKKPVVLSIDDLSYYHTYDLAGYPDKIVIDENGLPKCQYTDAQGNTTIGDYDVVPRLNSFIAEHPDASYKGARGMIAMTGYNGVFGYRTDVAYKTGENLTSDQSQWLSEHPDFNWDNDVAEATKVAQAIKDTGWEFACHTWGHISVTGASVDTLRTDQEKWQNTVANIVGPTDTIIFAHGADIGTWKTYEGSDQYAYFKSMGYNFYANVDGSQKAWIQIHDDYFRQGRIDLDGVVLYKALTGATDVVSDMFDINTVFDSRRPTPISAHGKA